MSIGPSAVDLPPYLPFIDPDHFADRPDFFPALEEIGYRAVLLGGTGGARMMDAVRAIRERTGLAVYAHPSSPGEVIPVDLVLFPAVMNSNSHYTRPFGSGSVACAMAVAEQRIPYLPIAYFVLGESTARWYSDAFLIRSKKLIVGYCLYASMMGYRHVFLDYEDPDIDVDPALLAAIKRTTDVRLLVSDEFTPEEAVRVRGMGVETIVTPSDLYEDAEDPLALAERFHRALLAG